MKLFISFIIALSLMGPALALGNVDCKHHEIYCAILKLNPQINKTFAMKLSDEIYNKSIKYNVDKYRIIAIMQQESNMQMDARNISTTTTSHKECNEWEECVTVETTISKTTDFGLFQFHINTMKRHNLNIYRVMTDMPFVVDFAVKMIARKINTCKTKWPKTPWACYNSASDDHHKKYVELVNRYYLGNRTVNP